MQIEKIKKLEQEIVGTGFLIVMVVFSGVFLSFSIVPSVFGEFLEVTPYGVDIYSFGVILCGAICILLLIELVFMIIKRKVRGGDRAQEKA